MGNCTEDDGQGSEEWDSSLDWNWDLDLGIGVVWKPGNGKPENGGPEKPGSGKPGNGKPGSGSGKPEIDRPERPDNWTTRPEFPEKPADCKCPRLPLKQRQIKTGIQYEYSQSDGKLIMST